MAGGAKNFLNKLINDEEYISYAQTAHQAWKEAKEKDGWKFGQERDKEKKTNPLLVSYDALPEKHKHLNKLSPYSVINFLRTEVVDDDTQISDLREYLDEMLKGTQAKQMHALAEYIHSHFVSSLIAQGEDTDSRTDLRTFDVLDKATKNWNTDISISILKHLKDLLDEYDAEED